MNNSDVYNLQQKTIQALINEASQGAICIPNIQRSYVWRPHQLANLVDSLMHGWPCGNLLFWKVSPEQKFFGARRFAKEIRSKECDDVISPSEDTANLHYTALVLDGQQRIQSLVIAFAENSEGYSATEKEWNADVGKSGGKNDEPIQKWLCFDLCNWEKSNISSNPSFYYRDHENSESLPMLRWATKEEIESSSGYLVKLNETKQIQNPSKEVEWLKERVFTLLKLKMPTITVTHEVKNTNEDEAIVQIFTRLNTAGTPLTKEEILSAKIKQNWREFPKKLEQLQKELDDFFNMNIENSDLVIGFNALIKANTKELDIYDAYREMGTNEKDWSDLWNDFKSRTLHLISRLVNDFFVRYKKEYQSLHAIWFVIALHYRCHDSADQWEDELMHLIIKWLMLGNWSKIWAHRSNASVTNLTNEIVTDSDNLKDMKDILKRWMSPEIKEAAKKELKDLRASARGSVRTYYHYLWVWMRQTPERAKLLAKFSPNGQTLDVDHILPADWVKNSPLHYHTLNRLGNCWLLGNKTNIRKGAKDFSSFLINNACENEGIPSKIYAEGLYQHKKEETNDENWNNAIDSEIQQREDLIKQELGDYIEKEDKIDLYYIADINTDKIYMGDNFLQHIRNESESKQAGYMRGIRYAYDQLKSSNDEGKQIAKTLTEKQNDNTLALTNEEWDYLMNLEINATYRVGWNAYLRYISGRNDRLNRSEHNVHEQNNGRRGIRNKDGYRNMIHEIARLWKSQSLEQFYDIYTFCADWIVRKKWYNSSYNCQYQSNGNAGNQNIFRDHWSKVITNREVFKYSKDITEAIREIEQEIKDLKNCQNQQWREYLNRNARIGSAIKGHFADYILPDLIDELKKQQSEQN